MKYLAGFELLFFGGGATGTHCVSLAGIDPTV